MVQKCREIAPKMPAERKPPQTPENADPPYQKAVNFCCRAKAAETKNDPPLYFTGDTPDLHVAGRAFVAFGG